MRPVDERTGMGDTTRIPDPPAKGTRPDGASSPAPSALTRRRLLAVSGAGLAAAVATLAACGTSSNDDDATSETTEQKPGTEADVLAMRTAASLEALALELYPVVLEKLEASPNAQVTDAIKTFVEHHQSHANLLRSVITRMRGTPHDEPNAQLITALRAEATAAATEADVLRFVLKIERMSAATYQAMVGTLDDRSLNHTAMEIGGSESRHVAYAAVLAGQNGAPLAFQRTDERVAPGTGI